MSADLAAAREIMVDSQVRTQDVTDLGIIDAMRAFPRETLAPAGKSWLAYADTEIEYAPGRWMLRPRDVAKLLQAVRPRAGERALAIAAPYAAAILSEIGLSVTAQADPAESLTGGAWDLVLSEGAVAETPAAWKEAVAAGGRLAVVERTGPIGRAMLYVRSDAGLGARVLFECAPTIMAGFEAAHGFVL